VLIYTGGFYDFTSDLTMKDTAYTSLALGAHTDTTYFTDPAGLQMFHLLSHTHGEGGKSLLVDGFNAARTLKARSKSAYDWLCKTPIPWHASGNEGITITPGKKFPVLSFADHFNEDPDPRLLQVRWNNDDRGVVGLRERDGMGAEKWYVAARLWSDILNMEKMQYWAQLEPGRPLSASSPKILFGDDSLTVRIVFDNWRVLHGRSAFTGKRRICGGYSESINMNGTYHC
jgi:trimethyllysine dioxygenase